MAIIGNAVVDMEGSRLNKMTAAAFEMALPILQVKFDTDVFIPAIVLVLNLNEITYHSCREMLRSSVDCQHGLVQHQIKDRRYENLLKRFTGINCIAF